MLNLSEYFQYKLLPFCKQLQSTCEQSSKIFWDNKREIFKTRESTRINVFLKRIRLYSTYLISVQRSVHRFGISKEAGEQNGSARRSGHANRNENLICRFHFSYRFTIDSRLFYARRRKVNTREYVSEDGGGRDPSRSGNETRGCSARRRNRREACVTPRETLGWRATTEGEAVLTNSSRNGDKERCPSFMKNSVDCELSLSLSAPCRVPLFCLDTPYLFILPSPFCLRLMIV